MRDTRTALVTPGGSDGERHLAAPTVGRYLFAPAVGSYLAPGADAGLLRILSRTWRLTVPEGGGGVVQKVLVTGRYVPVERGQPLLVLGREALGVEEQEAGLAAGTAEEALDIPEGAIVVRAPTDGIFYRQPSPEDPPYVAEGDAVERGKVLGLVEVMKCFNQIKFDGVGAAKAKVLRVVPGDSAEVKRGQALFVLEKA